MSNSSARRTERTMRALRPVREAASPIRIRIRWPPNGEHTARCPRYAPPACPTMKYYSRSINQERCGWMTT
jgi:hypothetical protein